MQPPLLEVENLHTHFSTDAGVVPAVDGVSLTVRAGEIVGIVGESGSGKSMTARSIMRLVAAPPGRIVGGRVHFHGKDLIKLDEARMRQVRGSEIAMIFQDPMTFLNPIMTIGAQLRETIRTHRHLRGRSLAMSAVEALREARVPSPDTVAGFYPHQLSGGMRQRVLIAIAIACQPALLIADEPTTALDVTTQAQILQLLKSIVQKRGMAMLFITHDLGVVADICDRVYVMYAGRVVEEASTLELFREPRHPYTRGLLRAVMGVTRRGAEFPTIEGNVPNLAFPPPGCRFHPRCAEIMPICRTLDPSLGLEHGAARAACWLYESPTA